MNCQKCEDLSRQLLTAKNSYFRATDAFAELLFSNEGSDEDYSSRRIAYHQLRTEYNAAREALESHSATHGARVMTAGSPR